MTNTDDHELLFCFFFDDHELLWVGEIQLRSSTHSCTVQDDEDTKMSFCSKPSKLTVDRLKHEDSASRMQPVLSFLPGHT